MNDNPKANSDSFSNKDLEDKLNKLSNQIDKADPPFDKSKHESESRIKITTLFLKWYFSLIAGGFVFSLVYNFLAAFINHYFSLGDRSLAYLEVTNTVSIITTTLSSGVGFVIGYYFKNKEDKD